MTAHPRSTEFARSLFANVRAEESLVAFDPRQLNPTRGARRLCK